MKKRRKTKNIYDEAITYDNIYAMWNIIRKTCKNKKALFYFSLNLSTNINYIYYLLKERKYRPSRYRTFIIFEPKPRLVMSQTITDKIVNHFIANYYLIPYLESKLIDSNVATRKNMGSSYADKLLKKYIRKIIINEKSKEIYCLKIDIKKYFYSIDHNLLINEVKRYISDEEVINLLKLVIKETNEDYVNQAIKYYNEHFKINIPYYINNKGLSIGAMSSQFLAIFYLNSLDHYIKEELKCNYYVRYMDDFIILSTDKERLKEIWIKIKKKLKELKLEENKKSNIYLLSKGVNFLGYRYKVINSKLIINCSKKTYYKIRRKLKKLYSKDKVLFNKTYASYYGYLKDIYDLRDVNFKMKIIDKYKSYKDKYKKMIVIVKDGIFYKTFYDDAKIMWYLFDYKYVNDMVSFGNAPFDRVIGKLNKLDISYVIIDKDNEVLKSFKENENYDSFFNMADNSYKKVQVKNGILDKVKIILDKYPDRYEELNRYLDSFIVDNDEKEEEK